MTEYPFPVEFIPKADQVYHGPKARMREFIRTFNSLGRSRIAERDYLYYIINRYGSLANNIEKVKFYKYYYSDDYLYFAIFWTSSNSLFRDKLYEDGKSITEQTGWYPLVTGSRISRRQQAADLHIRESLRKCMNKAKFESAFDFGIPISLEKISSGQGNSFLVKTSTWNVLLDASIDSEKLDLKKLDQRKKSIIVLSHAHTDHVGGLEEIIPNENFFIIATELTIDLVLNRFDYLYGLEKTLPKNFFYRVFPARYDCVYRFAKGGSLTFFHSAHYPGGVMTLFRFKNDKSLLYTGDLSFSSTYGIETKLQFTKPDSELWTEAHNHIDWALVDAALAKKTQETESSGTKWLEMVDNAISNNRIVLFLLEPQDLGFFLYLELALKYLIGPTKKRIPIYIDPFVKRLLNSMDKYFKLQRTHSVWPVLQPFLVQRKNLFESVWLYEMGTDWPSNIAYHRSKGSAALLILDYNQAMKDGYGDSVKFQNLVADSDKTFLVGKKSIAELQQQILSGFLVARWGKVKLNKDVFLLSGDHWLPHCSFTELQLLLKTIASRVSKIFLFHDYAETINDVAQSLRDKLGVDVNGISEEQKLE